MSMAGCHLFISSLYLQFLLDVFCFYCNIYLFISAGRNSSNIQLWNTTSSYSVEKVQVKLLKYISMVHIQNIYHLYLLNKFGNSSLNHPLLNGGIFNNHIRNSWMFWINNDANCHPSPVRNENPHRILGICLKLNFGSRMNNRDLKILNKVKCYIW